MTEARAFCPQCKQDAVFFKTGALNTCSTCGFQYQSSPTGPPPLPVSAPGNGWSFVSALMKALLVMAALAVVGAAVLFAGCAMLMKGF
ncbi:MAG TPA: hypothetical protein VK850_04920 [Candidatus Binatia bacterium]|nr:hypothetical protein [Candidatus Binatia bacterium]